VLSASTSRLLPTVVLAQAAAAIVVAALLLTYAATRPPAHGHVTAVRRNWRDLAKYLPVGLSIGILSPASMLIARSILSQSLSWRDVGVLQALWRSSDWITSIAAGLMSFYFLTRFSRAAGAGALTRELLHAAAFILIPAGVLLGLLLVNQKVILAGLYEATFVITDRAAALFLLGDWVRIASWISLYALLATRRTVAVAVGEVLSLPLFAGLLGVFSHGLTLERAALLYLLTYASYLAFNATALLIRGLR